MNLFVVDWNHDHLFGRLEGIEIDFPIEGVGENLRDFVIHVDLGLQNLTEITFTRHLIQSLSILWLYSKFGILNSDSDMWPFHKDTGLSKCDVDLDKATGLSLDALVEQVQDNLVDLGDVGMDALWDILVNVESHFHVVAFDVF